MEISPIKNTHFLLLALLDSTVWGHVYRDKQSLTTTMVDPKNSVQAILQLWVEMLKQTWLP
jgi:hypothetical protein